MNIHGDGNRSECPDLNILATYLDGNLDEEEKRVVDAHIQECQRCQEIFRFGSMTRQSRLAVSNTQSQKTDLDPLIQKLIPFGQLAMGQAIGRYIIVKPLGLGGMGEVYTAYDPELNRRVALKLLRTDVYVESNIDENVSRLMKEAQAMAQVSHPNVISIFDVMKINGKVVIAMEYFSGGTLESWLQAEQRSWQEIVDVFLSAGQGLAAAHTAKLVHRDFKPANVLLEKDGRVCVSDFGLVRGLDQDDLKRPVESLALNQRWDDELTKTGTFLGTPAYMSPEQLQGKKSEPRSDQFCFSVALFEALFGQRPFSGGTAEELLRSMVSGKTTPVEPKSDVPLWLRNVIQRGLAVSPDDRFGSMEDLLESLKNDPDEIARQQRSARNRKLTTGLLILLVIALPIGVWYGLRYRTYQLCKDSSQELVSVWDSSAKETIRSAFLSTGISYALGTWERVERIFEKYVLDWKSMRSEICEAKHIRGTQSEELFDLRMSCLKARKRELKALVQIFGESDAKVVANAVNASSALTNLVVCEDEKALRAPYAPPKSAATQKRVASIREGFSEVKAFDNTGKYQDGLLLAKKLEEKANTIGYVPIMAEALYWVGALLSRIGEFKRAETTFYRAAKAAGKIGDAHLAAKVMTKLVGLVGYRQARHEEGLSIGRYAGVMLGVAGGDEDTLSKLHSDLGMIYAGKGDYKKTLDLFQKALDIDQRNFGPKHHFVAKGLNNLGAIYRKLGQFDKAVEFFLRALAIKESSLDPGHPSIGVTLSNLGNMHVVRGEYTKAIELYLRALKIGEKAFGSDKPDSLALRGLGIAFKNLGDYEKALEYYRREQVIVEEQAGSEHPSVATIRNNICNVFHMQNKFNKSIECHLNTLKMRQRVLGLNHPDVAQSLCNLGNVFRSKGDFSKSLEFHLKGLKMIESLLGPEHPEVATSSIGLAEVFASEAEYEKALIYSQRALAILEKSFGAEHAKVAMLLVTIGRVLTEQGRSMQALKYLERMEAICQKKTCEPEKYGKGLFTLAKVLTATQGDQARATKLAKRAREIFGTVPARQIEKDVAEVNAWLKNRSQDIH